MTGISTLSCLSDKSYVKKKKKKSPTQSFWWCYDKFDLSYISNGIPIFFIGLSFYEYNQFLPINILSTL